MEVKVALLVAVVSDPARGKLGACCRDDEDDSGGELTRGGNASFSRVRRSFFGGHSAQSQLSGKSRAVIPAHLCVVLR